MSVRKSVLLPLVGLAAFGLLSLSLISPARGQGIPNWMNYQGRLTAPDGAPVADGAWPVTFRLYDAPTGGAALWTEERNVTTRDGAFRATLGQTAALDPSLFTRPLWLEIEVNGRKLLPRQALGTVPFAMTALSVPGGSVSTVMIANLSVTAEKIADGAVTEAKLAPGLSVPVGSVVSWWGNSAAVPTGWKLCDGTSVADNASPLNGTTLPDLRDKFIRGTSGNVRTGTPTGGEDQHTLTVDQMPAHAHGVTDPGHSHTVDAKTTGTEATGRGLTISGDFVDRVLINGVANVGSQRSTTGITIQNSGGGQPFSTLPSYVGLVYIMRVR